MTVTLESLKKSVGKKNNKSEIFAWLADMERAAGDLDGALQRVNGGLTLYPHDVAAMIVRAKILFQQEKYEECVQQCEDVLVKDPFSLAGQKIMGDAFDKLGKVSERNLCYRRYHDMDPLNNFWKEEYDVVDVAVATGVAASSMSEDEFSMPDFNATDFQGNNVKTLEELEAENAAAMGENAQEFTMGGLFKDDEQSSVEHSFEQAFGDAFGSLDDETPMDSTESDGQDSGLFEKSASSVGISLDDETPSEGSSAFGTTADELMAGFSSSGNTESFGEAPFASSDNSFDASALEDNGDDPFAALAAMLPNGDAAEDSMMDDLSQALNATMAEIAVSSMDEKPVEQFPVDDNISGTDVNSAMSNFFGMEEEAVAEESTGASPTSELSAPAAVDQPTSVDNAFNDIFGEDELPEEKPQEAPADEDQPTSVTGAFRAIFGEDELPEEKPQDAPVADQPTTVDNAFNDIFGEDELPEEKPQTAFAELDASDELELPAEEPTVAEAPVADQPTTVDNAFNDIFGEDELPEEKPQTAFAELDASDELELPAEEPAVAEAPVADQPTTVDNAFNDIFGEDELPEEKPQEASEELEIVDLELPAEEPTVAEAPVADQPTTVDNAFNDIFGEDELPEEKPQEASEELEIVDLELPAEEPAEPVASDDFTFIDETPAEKDDSGVSGAFNDIFGADDDLPEEKPAMVSEVETPVEPAISSAMDFVLDDEPAASEAPAEEAPAMEPPSATPFSVDNAFDSLFGDDEDLPEEKTAEASATPVAEDNSTLEEQVDLAESELELPASAKDGSSDLAHEMGGAFASMFGDQDDDLDLPALNESAPIEDKVTNNSVLDQQATSAAFEEAASEKLESDLDQSFSSLFGDDDDLELPAEEGAAAESFAPAAESAQDAPAVAGVDSLESELSGAFKGLFDMDDDSMNLSEDKPSNSGVDFLMSGDSDDEVSAGLINNPDAPLNRGAQDIDESLNTKTLAEIYFDQGLYGKALEIYSDLAQKEPENQEIASRCAEIEKIYREKFGGNG